MIYLRTRNSREAMNRVEIPARRVGRGRYSLSTGAVAFRGLAAARVACSDYRGTSVWESNRTATIGPSSSISPRTVSRRRSRSVVRGGSNLLTDHEVCFGSEIVSKGRPQAVYNAHRIAQANKSGVDVDARRRTRGSAPSAINSNRSAECLARISEILNRLGVSAKTLSTGELKRGSRRVFIGPSARLDPWTVRLPRAGVEIGSTISRFCGKVAAGHNTNNTKG